MKPSELNQMLKEVVAEELTKEGYIGHPEWDVEHGDGYTNDFQRAFAHSQATQKRPQGQRKEAEELAKKGKFVVISDNNIHCKTTDAVLGSCVAIEGVFDTEEEANKKAEEIAPYTDGVGVITPDSIKPKTYHDPKPSAGEDDVPFQESQGKRICAWCKKDMGAASTEEDTHGICPDCEKKFNDDAEQMPLDPNLMARDAKLEALKKRRDPDGIEEINYTKTSAGQSVMAQGAPGSVVRFATENPEVMKQMRDWAKDCQWKEEPEEIDEMSDEDILRGVQRHYEGGIKAFIQDSQSKAEVPVGYKEGIESNIPTRRHPNCKDSNCSVCLDDHDKLLKYFQQRLGQPHQDFLRLYRKWLDDNEIPAEVNGWGSKEAFDPKNIELFVKSNLDEGYGAGDMSKDPKKAFKKARWTVKFDENISTSELKSLVKEIIEETLGENSQYDHFSVTKENMWPNPDVELKQYTDVSQWEKDNVENLTGKYKGEPLHNYGFLYKVGALVPTGEFNMNNAMKLWNMAKKKQQQNIKLGTPAGFGFSDPRKLYEAKGANQKEKIRNLIKESVGAVLKEYSEQEEIKLINQVAAITRTAISRTSTMEPTEAMRQFKDIDALAQKLVKMHSEKTGRNSETGIYDVPGSDPKTGIHNDPKEEQRSALGVTQETVSRTKKVLEQMLFQKRKK